MDKKEMLEFIRKHPVAFMATTEGRAARVRGMETYRADENGLIFYTDKHKQVYKQLGENPDMEVCYFGRGMQVRVRGIIEELEDDDLKRDIVTNRSFLQPMDEAGYANMALFRLRGKATSWAIEDEGNPVSTFIEF